MPDPVLNALRRKLAAYRAAGRADLVERVAARITELEGGDQPEPEPEPEPAPAPEPQPEAPPRSGPGSGKESWARYAEDLGYQVADDMTRDDIIELVEGDQP